MTTWTSPPDPDLDRDPFDRHLHPITHPCPRADRHGPHQWRPVDHSGGVRCPGAASRGHQTARTATNAPADDSQATRHEKGRP